MGFFQELWKESMESIAGYRQYLDNIKNQSKWLYLSICSLILGALIMFGCFLYSFSPVIIAFVTFSPLQNENPVMEGLVLNILILGMLIAFVPMFISVIFVATPRNLQNPSRKKIPPFTDRDEVFIVHGHDESLLNEVGVYLSSIKIDPIILKHKANEGTGWLFDKFKKHSNVKFAIVLYTPDDIGKEKNKEKYSDRPRQNVILELGFFLGKLGNEGVWILYKDFPETPSDIIGGTVQKYDANGGWKIELNKSLGSAGVRFKQS